MQLSKCLQLCYFLNSWENWWAASWTTPYNCKSTQKAYNKRPPLPRYSIHHMGSVQGHFLHHFSGQQQCFIFKTVDTQAGGIVGFNKAIKVKWFIQFKSEGHESVAGWSLIQYESSHVHLDHLNHSPFLLSHQIKGYVQRWHYKPMYQGQSPSGVREKRSYSFPTCMLNYTIQFHYLQWPDGQLPCLS